MTEFDVSAVDLSGVLNTSAEEKAKQVPDPATYTFCVCCPKLKKNSARQGF